ncbi:tetratricopeptide repeat protein [Cytobacillus firmus]|uniref:tetratricopeptide repeat protein n=1 Tax=Bacillaceae TaxID=186817 RepID=UPI00209F71EC|nr:tetratricopeptide repeat protein [Priestia flexa]MCP1190820.1 sel1 repeat family protein [Priestia flexa]
MDSNFEMRKFIDENNEENENVPSVLYKKAVNHMDKGYYWEAIDLYEKAANLGSVKAQSDLANLYLYGIEEIGIKSYHPNALKWFLKLAEQGDEEAQFQCDYLYYYGLRNSQESKETIEEVLETSEVEDTNAFKLAGQMYYFGEGVERDVQIGIEYFRRAADQGDVDALIAVCACCYENGKLGETISYLNMVESHHYVLTESHMNWLAQIKYNLMDEIRI